MVCYLFMRRIVVANYPHTLFWLTGPALFCAFIWWVTPPLKRFFAMLEW